MKNISAMDRLFFLPVVAVLVRILLLLHLSSTHYKFLYNIYIGTNLGRQTDSRAPPCSCRSVQVYKITYHLVTAVCELPPCIEHPLKIL